jgi:hypothetical protein
MKMNAQREGTNLKIEIRIALSMLGRDPNEIDTRRMSLTDLRALRSKLRAEYKATKAA